MSRTNILLSSGWMDYILATALVIVIIMIWAYSPTLGSTTPSSTEPLEVYEPSFGDLTHKEIPRTQTAVNGGSPESVIIDSIPITHAVQPEEAEDASMAAVYSDEKPPISLTFDAAVARNALMRSRDKRVFDAIANRTTDYYRPFYEEELSRCDNRDWWDDVAYPINDSGEYQMTPEQAPSDREDTPWDSSSVPFGRTA